MNVHEYLDKVDQVSALATKPSLSTREVQQQNALLAIIAASKHLYTPEQVRSASRDRLLRASGLPRDPDRGRRLGFFPEDIEREYRVWGPTGKCRPSFVPDDRETRAQVENPPTPSSISYTQGPAGGFFVAPDMYNRAMETGKEYDRIFDENFSNVIESDTGAAFMLPWLDDVSQKGTLVSERTQSSEVDASLGTTQFNAWAYRSGKVSISRELLQDANFGWPKLLERALAIRLARAIGADLATGSGVNKPTGIITGAFGAGASIVVASGSSANTGGAETGSTSIGTKDVGLLYQNLNPWWRPGAKFYANDATIQYLNQLLDKNGRPVVDFAVGPTRDSSGPKIWGYDVCVCPSFPQIGNGNSVMVFGHPSAFVQRRVPSSCYLRRYQELPGLIENDMVAFEMWLRVDSNVAASTSIVPFAILQCHS